MAGGIPKDKALDPSPFRKWCEARIAPDPKEWSGAIGELAGRVTAEQLAEDLGISERRLYAWRFENKGLDLELLEDALHRAGVELRALYPDPPEREAPRDPRPMGPPPGLGSKLSDEQVRVLHRLHIERGLSLRELGRRLYRQLGYATDEAATFGIRNGFRRLGLEAQWRHPTKLETTPRCVDLKANGEPCGGLRIKGSDKCFPHAYPEKARQSIQVASAARKEVAA
jgi:transcriptional regulator with XRE-family HTH domain